MEYLPYISFDMRYMGESFRSGDLSSIYASYDAGDGRGQSAYAPAMMARLLLYGYAVGVFSSRKIQAKTFEDVAFRFLSADEHPDHSTLAEFRKRHLEALAGLFTQALQLCQKAGLVKLGHVAIDGTKLQGNASRGPTDRSSSVGWKQAQGDELWALGRGGEKAEG